MSRARIMTGARIERPPPLSNAERASAGSVSRSGARRETRARPARCPRKNTASITSAASRLPARIVHQASDSNSHSASIATIATKNTSKQQNSMTKPNRSRGSRSARARRPAASQPKMTKASRGPPCTEHAGARDHQRAGITQPVEERGAQQGRGAQRHARGEIVERGTTARPRPRPQPGQQPFAGNARPRPEQRAPESAMADEEIHQHAARRQGVGDEDRSTTPARPAPDARARRRTARKNTSKHMSAMNSIEQPARLALGRDDQVGDEHADHREHDPVEHRVLHDQAGRWARRRGRSRPGTSPRRGARAFGTGGRARRRRSGTRRRRGRRR